MFGLMRKRQTMTEDKLAKIFEIANNAIYFQDSSDYLPALYQICNVIKPNDETIGEVCIE